jgi:hypothetical protein
LYYLYNRYAVCVKENIVDLRKHQTKGTFASDLPVRSVGHFSLLISYLTVAGSHKRVAQFQYQHISRGFHKLAQENTYIHTNVFLSENQ